jgi:molybdopterin-containing oxidoreductase family iron-sulfur binding subunit
LASTDEFKDAAASEFPESAWDELPLAARRQFLKVMGGSLALAGLTSCRWPEEEIVPFAHRPEGFDPGVPRYFATAFEHRGSAIGVIATSYDGRPIKLEGNPQHPDSKGGLSAVGQAQVLELYDPDRSRQLRETVQSESYPRTWDEFNAAVQEQLDGSNGRGLAVLSEETSSPSVSRLRAAFLERFPEANWVEYEPASRVEEREGVRNVARVAGRPVPDLNQAKVLACFGADPFGRHPAGLRMAREYAEARKPEAGEMNRLHVVETSWSQAGAMADYRLATSVSQQAVVLAGVAVSLVDDHGLGLPVAVVDELRAGAAELDDRSREFSLRLAADLADNNERSLVLVGAELPAALHSLAVLLNSALGAVGNTVRYLEESDTRQTSRLTEFSELVAAMGNGEVETLLILGGNPIFDAPADFEFESSLARVGMSIHLSLYSNETSNACAWHLPRAHFLESWGDALSWDGMWTTIQPLIAPLYGGKTVAEVLAMVIGDGPRSAFDITRETFALEFGQDGVDRAWRQALHEGVAPRTVLEELNLERVQPRIEEIAAGFQAVAGRNPTTDSQIELVFFVDSKLDDGRFANNGWLQEMPDPITKTTWDNAALLSPTTARDLGLVDGEIVEIEAAGTTVEMPAFVLPGHARGSVSVALGYGRTAAGEVGSGIGTNVYPLRTATEMKSTSAVVRGTGRHYQLASTQDHHAIDKLGYESRLGRIGELIREASLDDFTAHPDVIQHMGHHPPLFSLWKEHEYQGEQWGMAIDLNVCTGCSACVVACQAENNIPVVGREQVLSQREMHWLRVDRYFKTEKGIGVDEVEDAELAYQPLACVQCEMAPCESVCPVAATQHTRDGLNAMVYNRCVGTRYCSNNCPYKVRRFNFLNYYKDFSEIEQMQLNPEVTVRSRGVMEKCTYCVQRIESVRIQAKNERRPIHDGEIVPACAQTCPTQAIVFGDLNDPESKISQLREDPRSYATLAELNIRPRTHYMAKIKNVTNGQTHSDGKESA